MSSHVKSDQPTTGQKEKNKKYKNNLSNIVKLKESRLDILNRDILNTIRKPISQ